ncbi:MAG: homoserine O-acetyltransferase [Candidatus Baltobacteraceae bacterium]
MIERTLQIGRLKLSEGRVLKGVEQRVTIYGEPNAQRSNIVLVPHALTGSGRVVEWWSGLLGRERLIDPQHWCIVGINALGGCYGSTGPASLAPDGAPYGDRFPTITVQDMVSAQARALEQLGFEQLALVIGGSLGGMQALQWALDFPKRVARAVVVGASDRLSAMGIALNTIQRECIALDPVDGLGTARKLAILTYKSDALLRERHGRKPDRSGHERFDIEGYLAHQAGRFERRMDPISYLRLSRAMDLFDPRDQAIIDRSPELTFVGISSDWLFLPHDVRAAAERFAELGFLTQYLELDSGHGHDAFLAEPQALALLLENLAAPR